MSKKFFLVVVDYTHGGFGVGVYAKSREELEGVLGTKSTLGGRGISIIERGIEEHPLVKYLGKRLAIYDIEKPEGLLLKMIEK